MCVYACLGMDGEERLRERQSRGFRIHILGQLRPGFLNRDIVWNSPGTKGRGGNRRTTRPVPTCSSCLVDHAIVQETEPTYRRHSQIPEKERRHSRAGPSFRIGLGRKKQKYSALCATAQRLSKERKIDFDPTFLYPIMSSLGFMNPDFVLLNKFIVDVTKDTLKKEQIRRLLDGRLRHFVSLC